MQLLRSDDKIDLPTRPQVIGLLDCAFNQEVIGKRALQPFDEKEEKMEDPSSRDIDVDSMVEQGLRGVVDMARGKCATEL